MFKLSTLRAAVASAVFLTGAGAGVAHAGDAKYDPGVTDTEIRIGNTLPYSGPLSAYGTVGKAMSAYFEKINAAGGVNGRSILFMSEDDAYNPNNSLTQTRKLVERDNVFFMYGVLGTPPNLAIREYLNRKKIPHLFSITGLTELGNYEEFPYTMGWLPSFQTEGKIYIQHIIETNPDAKIGILFQNGDYGRDFTKGITDALGEEKANMIIAMESFESSDPTVDAQVVSLKATGADALIIVSTPKFAAQALKKVRQLDWHPTTYLNNVANSIASVMEPSGAVGNTDQSYITTFYERDPSDTQWADSKALKDYMAWITEFYPEGDPNESLNVYGYNLAQVLVQILDQMGDDMTREAVMESVTNLDLELPMLLPGVRVKTGPTDYHPINQMQLARWDGRGWDLFGDVYTAE